MQRRRSAIAADSKKMSRDSIDAASARDQINERRMARQGYDLQLTRYDEHGWRATFYTTGMEHSPTGAIGTSWERTPWHAVQTAAWEALRSGQRRIARWRAFRDPKCENIGRRTERAYLPGARVDPVPPAPAPLKGSCRRRRTFPVAWTTPDPWDAVMRQVTILDLVPYEKTERFLVHSGLAGSSGREHTPNSAGSRRPGTPAHEAGVQPRGA